MSEQLNLAKQIEIAEKSFANRPETERPITNTPHFTGIPFYRTEYNGSNSYYADLSPEATRSGLKAVAVFGNDKYIFPIYNDLDLIKQYTKPIYRRCEFVSVWVNSDENRDKALASLRNYSTLFQFKGDPTAKKNKATETNPTSYYVYMSRDGKITASLDETLDFSSRLSELDLDS